MAKDWHETLTKQADLAERMVRDLPVVLAQADLTWERACRLYLSLEKGEMALTRIIEQMEEQNLDKPLCEAAAALHDVWAKLSAATAHKIHVTGYRVETPARRDSSRRCAQDETATPHSRLRRH